MSHGSSGILGLVADFHYDYLDLAQLSLEKLIILLPAGPNVYRGQLTQLGITTARSYRLIDAADMPPSRGPDPVRSVPEITGPEPEFPRRAEWLRERFRERSWNRNDPLRQNGPDPKTIDKILAGQAVREDVLERLASALSNKWAKVSVIEIPQN